MFPERVGASDEARSLTFQNWNSRACRLANGLLSLGLQRGDRVGVLAYNCVEWLEIYAAGAKAGLILVPINFRLAAPEVGYILRDCGAGALILQDKFLPVAEELRTRIEMRADRYVHFGGPRPRGCLDYENLIQRSSDAEPDVLVQPADTWALMYTSGTTGHPKGVIRSHLASALHSLVTDVEFGFSRRDVGLLVMPICHANSRSSDCWRPRLAGRQTAARPTDRS
jgi:fatty-acyl-CoA synthase